MTHPPSSHLAYGVIVIGAGVAGLAAARALRAAGVAVTLIEALPRIGGRAITAHVGGEPFDLGATWLHAAERNPLVGLAGPHDELVDTDAHRHERLTIAGRPATPAEHAAYDAAWDAIDSVVAPALAGPDTTLAAALAPVAGAPWTRLLAQWEGATIAAADADVLGLQDWHRNRLDGSNRVPRQGVGAFLARVLATEATLGCPAHRITWSGPGVAVDTPRGTIRAAAAIVTVSTGVLQAGTIRFDPPLPPTLQAAIHALPMGLLSKLALPLTGPLDLAANTLLVDRDGTMTFNARPLGRNHIAGFVGGRLAWSVAPDPAAFADLAHTELRRMLGPAALSPTALGPPVGQTDWGTNPAFRGAYAYAGPGDAGQREALGAAFPAERLVFAGEATRTDGLAGTVGGAYLAGIEAARRLLDAA